MQLQEYHRDLVTCLLPRLRADCSNTLCCHSNVTSIARSSAIFPPVNESPVPSVPSGCDSVRFTVSHCPDGVARREAVCKTFVLAGDPTCHGGTRHNVFPVSSSGIRLANHVRPFRRHPLHIPIWHPGAGPAR